MLITTSDYISRDLLITLLSLCGNLFLNRSKKMTLKNLPRIPIVLVVLLVAAFSSAQDDSCLVEEKHNVTLVSVHEPAHVLLILNNETSVEDCLKMCCRYKGPDGGIG